jgi:biopolymer transport protein TolR
MGMSGSQPRAGARTVMSEINVTPLVDVMLVLLIIFMVTAPMMQQGLDVQLPETASSGVTTTEDPLVLVVLKDGSLRIGEAKVNMNGLGKKLQAIFGTRKNKQVYIQADRHVPYGVVAEAMGEIRAAGIFSISMITLPKAGS